jgi:uncharacterized membrane protein YhdT
MSDTPRSGLAGAPRTVRIGLVLLVVGLVFLAATVLPFFWGSHNRPVWLNAGCMLAPMGFVIAVVGSVRAGRADQRRALAAASTDSGLFGPAGGQNSPESGLD